MALCPKLAGKERRVFHCKQETLASYLYCLLLVTGYGQKNRHEVEEKDLKEFLRLQQMASEEDEDTDG